ncbi:EscU/YscU/HrcU family type III secretion system export apparatus switch protein [Bordetella genomosp. 5]|uniref:EscU/YscU/HrcU family type III secretion system export apparatus switch protein n=1 Tax=Bordetella genomosp. 5 TaxID=1395608 RepID=A0A261TB74_9BORD|nr:type III secretion system export apparatus subunit SctU [Bordetella genomosp. 5]OZI39898.1 EscU/YscU/HrcU family type III secretion system export apparatus switch protein [Bordetella genomosp. 5]OZI46655.1 EscU/YscU/HrcU family type III secretion system export apparatus switch protein [Bordetella genomosp. 5]
MSGEKTEQPTHKKLRDARNKGEVAHSKDFTQTLLVLALFGYMLGNAQNIIESLGRLMLLPADLIGMPFEVALPQALDAGLREATTLVLPFVLIVLIVGMFGEFLQVGVVLAFQKLKPSGQKLNPMTNLKNTFSKKNLVEFLKSTLKIAFLSALVTIVVRDALPELMSVPYSGLAGLQTGVGGMLRTLIVNIAVAYVVISLADFAWQRFQHRKGLMMSKEEVKQEYKEMEGDPHIKHKRKHLHQEMVMHGATGQARKASVVVTNPTHLAVALYYEPDETPLPLVLAKGEGTLAEAMMQAAREAGVPVMQNIPLARALMAQAQPDQYIPSELIEPVAEVLRLVRKLAAEQETP